MSLHRSSLSTPPVDTEVQIQIGSATLGGTFNLPPDSYGLLIFAHGSGSSRFSPRNRRVAEDLRISGFGTLLFDLLTEEEEAADSRTAHLRFDIGLLADRLRLVTRWVRLQEAAQHLPIGYFGSSTGAAAALVAAATQPEGVFAVVSRGGRPDLADDHLSAVMAPTLLIVGGADDPVLELNREALAAMRAEKRLEIIPGASHLFEEPGALEEVARLAGAWFGAHLPDSRGDA